MHGWRLIDTLDMSDEVMSVLLLRPNQDDDGFHIVQASAFQGDLYPDHLEGNVGWNDRIEDALYWRPMPAMPRMMELTVDRSAACALIEVM
jgi:hypothetical protein